MKNLEKNNFLVLLVSHRWARWNPPGWKLIILQTCVILHEFEENLAENAQTSNFTSNFTLVFLFDEERDS